MEPPTLLPVILSGGAGTRLWPLSRKSRPKPFLPLPDGESLLQKTLRRVQRLPGADAVLTVTNRDYYFQTRDAYAAANAGGTAAPAPAPALRYLLEPDGRNTAPAIAAAALWARGNVGPQCRLLVLPADHLIQDEAAFAKAVQTACSQADAGRLVTFGIVPTAPETGFGYIERGDSLDDGAYAVRRFVEKPDAATAQAFLAQGGHLWNAGMFCFRAEDVLAALEQYAPEILAGTVSCWEESRRNGDTTELAACFAQVPALSIDYAVMERADRVAVVPAELGWNDIGSWTSYGQLVAPDEHGNRVHGTESVLVDAKNCLVHSPDRLATLLGVQNLVVVDTPDALLIADAERAQDVKEIVAELKRRGSNTHELHRTVHRPWGTYTVLEEGNRFKIKRIVVKPQASLSMQMHHHRSEHWVVVSGTAKVVNGLHETLVRTNESTYISAGTPHRLLNPGVIDLVMIEVQSGEYLGEDDIVRTDDAYGRV